MSLRPPFRYWIKVTGTGPGGSSDPGNFTLAASGPTTVPPAIGSNLQLSGIIFEASSALIFASTPVELPPGATVPIQMTISSDRFYEIVPRSIDGSTTAFPFYLCYGPLGPGGL